MQTHELDTKVQNTRQEELVTNTNVKHYILATDVLKHDPLSFKKFVGNHVYILSETTKYFSDIVEFPKRHTDIAVFQAKEALIRLKEAINGNSKKTVLPAGLLLKDVNVTLHIVKCNKPISAQSDILTFANELKVKYPNESVILVSKTLNTRLDCDFANITAQDYKNDKVYEEEISPYFQKVVLSDEKYIKLQQDISTFSVKDLGISLFPNCFLEVYCESDKATPIFIKYDGKHFVNLSHRYNDFAGIKPKNTEQKFVFDLLGDKNVELVTITGSAGSGKTILSVAAALQLAIKDGLYDKIIYVKPTLPADDGQGYLKGDLYDKLRPYMMSFFDSLSVILTKNEASNKVYRKFLDSAFDANDKTPIDVEKFAKNLIDRQLLELTCFSYMRGRNIRNSIVIVDEGQQTTPFIAKLMLTRISENAKFVFIGDPSDNQIDTTSVDPRSNGLVYLAARLKNSPITGHVSLKAVERGKLAELADEML
ncbi:MAG: PhoH family protein [Clostridia bacterium]|nr:PhoH family protein [Clostridia bacterium]